MQQARAYRGAKGSCAQGFGKTEAQCTEQQSGTQIVAVCQRAPIADPAAGATIRKRVFSAEMGDVAVHDDGS